MLKNITQNLVNYRLKGLFLMQELAQKKQLEETLDKLWNNLSKEQREVLKIALGNSVEDLTDRMALVKKLEEDLNNSCPPQKQIIKSD